MVWLLMNQILFLIAHSEYYLKFTVLDPNPHTYPAKSKAKECDRPVDI
jgi:hypothetical protein